MLSSLVENTCCEYFVCVHIDVGRNGKMSKIHMFDQGLPTAVDIQAADTLRRIIASRVEEADADEVPISFAGDDGERGEIVLTRALAKSFLEILRLISSGKGFHLLPYAAELTTQQAADFLNVSRPYLIKLLENEEIEFRLVGRHRRIKAEDLFRYKGTRDQIRADALSELAQIDSENGLL